MSLGDLPFFQQGPHLGSGLGLCMNCRNAIGARDVFSGCYSCAACIGEVARYLALYRQGSMDGHHRVEVRNDLMERLAVDARESDGLSD